VESSRQPLVCSGGERDCAREKRGDLQARTSAYATAILTATHAILRRATFSICLGGTP
jgi:hypothetical protein